VKKTKLIHQQRKMALKALFSAVTRKKASKALF
jgi:hypothetical protein